MLLLECFMIGCSSLIIGLILHFLLGHHALHANSPNMKKEMMRLSLLLFLTGVFTHLIYEFSGLNKWYCKYYKKK